MITEKIKQKELELRDPSRSLYRNSSTLSRHEKWKTAHQRPDGEFTSEATCEVGEKIVSRCFFSTLLTLVNSIR